MPDRAGRPRLRAVPHAFVALGILGASACAQDTSDAPFGQSLEVIITECQLNRSVLEPGLHRVSVSPGANGEFGRLVVTDTSGAEVFTSASESGGEWVSEEDLYTFTCTVEGEDATSKIISRTRIGPNGREVTPQGQ